MPDILDFFVGEDHVGFLVGNTDLPFLVSPPFGLAQAATRFDDLCTGHDCWPPRRNDQASPNVFVNKRGWHRQGDHWPTHCCSGACHDGRLQTGSHTVFVNSKQAGRVRDPVDCGSKVAEGSPNVFAGG